jgi:hypothetical protein
MIPVPRTMMRAPSSQPLPIASFMESPPTAAAAAAEGDASVIPDHIGLCGKSQCIRNRALLSRGPSYIYKPIEQVRYHSLPWWWIVSVVVALGWSVACVQKSQVVLGILNFVGAFLPLWRQMYVQTPIHWLLIAWIIMGITFFYMP